MTEQTEGMTTAQDAQQLADALRAVVAYFYPNADPEKRSEAAYKAGLALGMHDANRKHFPQLYKEEGK
jgi:hypothetical protein